LNNDITQNERIRDLINEIVLDEKKFGQDQQRVTSEVRRMTAIAKKNNVIEKGLYEAMNVKRGLRDKNGVGVLAGLTNVSDIQAKKLVDGVEVPCEGHLYFRGYEINELVDGFYNAGRFGYEETAYLLLFGELPTVDELEDFKTILAKRRNLPKNFTRDVIMKAPSANMMNNLSRAVLMLYTYDPLADDTSLSNVLKQSLNLIAQLPRIMVYSHWAYSYHKLGDNICIYAPRPDLSTAENILYMLRADHKYTELEARVLDMVLVLQMDHGGGNNSTFTTRVVTSSGTDTYSAVAAALGSLKGPKHGGANIKVVQMFDDMKQSINDWTSEKEIKDYLRKILNKEAFDEKGLIYGMGHAVYSVSDPRADILRSMVGKLAAEEGMEDEYELYRIVERVAPDLIEEKHPTGKRVSPNVDFYSGLVYSMLSLPAELYTPMFAAARIVGWSAHRMEELQNNDKITRPAYKPVQKIRSYVEMENR